MKSYISIKISLLIAFLSSVTCFFLFKLFYYEMPLDVALLYASMCFFSVFSICFAIVHYFIVSRVKNIYATIHSMDKKQAISIKKKDALMELEEDVLQWANEREKEMERLKETEKFRKEFIGNLAHELKTPVFSVQGYILTLLEGGLEDETINRKFLLKASKAIDRITNVIEDMDTITRIESGILELDLSKFNVITTIKNVFFELEEKAKENSISLKIEAINTDSMLVFADRQKMEQVLYNLVTNAIYYGKKNGEVIVKLSTTKDKILVEVMDNGIGIAKEHLPRLFERFYRVEKSRTRNKGGSGIGLAIVKHIIDAHKQSIRVKSELEKGTVFSFSLNKG